MTAETLNLNGRVQVATQAVNNAVTSNCTARSQGCAPSDAQADPFTMEPNRCLKEPK